MNRLGSVSRRNAWMAAVTLGAGVSLAVSLPPASAADFSNPASIQIGPGASQPSTIVVAGHPLLTDVNVTLNEFSHGWPSEVDVLLEGPTGIRVMLMSDVPSTNPSCAFPTGGIELTFDDSAATSVPSDSAITGGTYRPTNATDGVNCNEAGGDSLVPSPTATTLSAFNGTNPNGIWTLHVADDTSTINEGSFIADGWTLQLAASASLPQPQSAPACAGLTATIVGTSGADQLVGTPGPDVIAAGAGDDVVYAIGGDDVICGDGGRDVLRADGGRDRLFGGDGRDVCRGGKGKDKASGCEKKRGI